MALRDKLRRLEKTMRGLLGCIELADGSRYFYEPGEVWREVFRHGSRCLTSDYRGEPRPKPPKILQAITKAKNRRAAVEQFIASGSHPFMAYEMEALVERGEFVPRSFLAGHTYEESVEHFARRNKKKE